VSPDLEKVPVERLIANLQAAIDKNPNNLRAVLNLARTHAMAYSKKSEIAEVAKPLPPPPAQPPSVNQRTVKLPTDEPLPVWSHGYGPATPVYFDEVVPTSDRAKLERARQHLVKALTLYKRAAELAPQDLVVRLGLAWLTAESGDQKTAIALYRDIVAQAWANEQTLTQSKLGQPFITNEAAGYLIPLLDADKDREEIARLKQWSNKLSELPRLVTPVAIPLKAGMRAQDFEDRFAAVSFDADGSGLSKPWTWITPDAAWLVHLARPDTRISSALQWFGNVTFWLFWDNGYEAMAALDDNFDGLLESGELDGLALWHDTNANGVSEPAEIESLASHGIVALSYHYQIDHDHPDQIAFVADGVRFADGSTRASYDVILHPAAARLPL
jgi:tetratricopeptide (TPR) repeat protein